MTTITLSCNTCRGRLTSGDVSEIVEWDVEHDEICGEEPDIVMPCGAVVRTFNDLTAHAEVCSICTADGSDNPRGLPVTPCRLLSTHPSHTTGGHARGIERWCPGIPDDHTQRCCLQHAHHTTPHRGCILR